MKYQNKECGCQEEFECFESGGGMGYNERLIRTRECVKHGGTIPTKEIPELDKLQKDYDSIQKFIDNKTYWYNMEVEHSKKELERLRLEINKLVNKKINL